MSRPRSLHRLGREELVEELRRLRGTPEVVLRDGEFLDLVLPALRADFEAYAEYEYAEEAPLSADLHVFGGADDRMIGTGKLDAWRSHTAGRFSLDVLPGEHFFPFSHSAAFVAAFVRVVNGIVARENAAPRWEALR
jgi:surfactin synthase thioesterase subunit